MEAQYSEYPAMFKNHPFGFVLAVALIPVVLGIVILIVWYLKCRSIKLEFAGSDLILETGLLSKDRTELNVHSIRTFNVHQSFFNRLFDVGTISVYTAGDEPEIEVAGLPRPHELRGMIKGITD